MNKYYMIEVAFDNKYSYLFKLNIKPAKFIGLRYFES